MNRIINRSLKAAFFIFVGVLFSGLPVSADHFDNWVEIKAPHFIVISNAGEREGRRIAKQFEDVRGMFEQSFPKLRVDFGKPTIVFALKNEDSLKLLIPSYGQNKNAMKIAGLYKTSYDRNYAVIRTDVTGTGATEFHALYHEYAHGLFRLNYRGLPLWMDEGLAEYWGNSQIENKQANVGLVDARQIRILQQNRMLPVSTLITLDGSSPLYNTQDHAGIFYAQSWLMVHYFQNGEGMREKGLLNKFLTALQSTDDPIAAANQSFGDLKKLDEKLEWYSRQQTYTYQRVPLHLEISEKEFSARALSRAEAMVAQADYLLRSGHQGEAITLLHEAEGVDPKLPGLHDALGYYHFARADYANATKEYDEALALNPNDAMVYQYRANILLRQKGYKPETTPEIRTNLEKVISLQPDFAPAHAFLCIAYSQMTETKSKALAEARRAAELEPGNLAYYIDIGKALLAEGKTDDARRVAERAQKVATLPRDRTMATLFLRQVEAKRNPSAAQTPTGETADTIPGETAAATPAAQTSKLEGQISELLCGHPPEVLFTLSTGGQSTLLHVRDISKIEIRDAGQASTAAASPCAKWKDRKATIVYEATAQGTANGEVKSIELQ
ncbi:MAG TPA: hypothetical protein VN025_04560 [Candidatus Dormibacteraeota bacterium]|jgi:tetratricopeptide (TPR) repeat protein|nr:hypothetical protein [Candidatus Dormibacteraeota bacterium]